MNSFIKFPNMRTGTNILQENHYSQARMLRYSAYHDSNFNRAPQFVLKKLNVEFCGKAYQVSVQSFKKKTENQRWEN